MAEEKLTPCNISRSEEAARYTLRKYGNRLSGIEHGFIIGLSIDKGKSNTCQKMSSVCRKSTLTAGLPGKDTGVDTGKMV